MERVRARIDELSSRQLNQIRCATNRGHRESEDKSLFPRDVWDVVWETPSRSLYCLTDFGVELQTTMSKDFNDACPNMTADEVVRYNMRKYSGEAGQ